MHFKSFCFLPQNVPDPLFFNGSPGVLSLLEFSKCAVFAISTSTEEGPPLKMSTSQSCTPIFMNLSKRTPNGTRIAAVSLPLLTLCAVSPSNLVPTASNALHAERCRDNAVFLPRHRRLLFRYLQRQAGNRHPLSPNLSVRFSLPYHPSRHAMTSGCTKAPAERLLCGGLLSYGCCSLSEAVVPIRSLPVSCSGP